MLQKFLNQSLLKDTPCNSDSIESHTRVIRDTRIGNNVRRGNHCPFEVRLKIYMDVLTKNMNRMNKLIV